MTDDPCSCLTGVRGLCPPCWQRRRKTVQARIAELDSIAQPDRRDVHDTR